MSDKGFVAGSLSEETHGSNSSSLHFSLCIDGSAPLPKLVVFAAFAEITTASQNDDMSPFVAVRLAGHSSHYLTCLKADMEQPETDCGEHGT